MGRVKEEDKIVWVKLDCPKCGKYLGHIKEESQSYCSTCNKFYPAKKE